MAVSSLFVRDPRMLRTYSTRGRDFTMTHFELLSVAVILSAAIATPVFAQPAFSEPAAFQAMHPDRDVLNEGALTPAAKMGLELPGDAAGGSYASAPVKRMSAKHFGNAHNM
jgi:hypothetical protein